MKEMMSSRFQPKLYAMPMPAWGQPSLMATNRSPSRSLISDLYIFLPSMFISVRG